MVLNVFVMAAIGFAMSYWSSWWPVLPGIALMLGVWLFFVHLRPMQSDASVEESSVEAKALALEAVASVVVGIATS